MDINSLKVLFTSLPGRYARALFCEGESNACLDRILENFSKLDMFLKNNSTVKKLLTGYCVNKTDLASAWITIGDNLSFCKIFSNFIQQIIKNKRFNLVNQIKYVYTVAFTKYKNERSVVISSVLKLAPEQKSRIEKLIVGIFNEKTTIRYKINEKILAGIKISSEELVIDASALAQIKQLSEFYRNLRIGTVYEN